MSGLVAFVDCETSGLDPRRHQPWEVALITPDGIEHEWMLPVDESKADLIALNIGGYFERFDRSFIRYSRGGVSVSPRYEFARDFQKLTNGLHLAGAVVSFDANMIGALMLDVGVIPAWHYHLIDVEALAAGYVRGRAKGIALAAPGAGQCAGVPSIAQWSAALDAGKVGQTLPWTSYDLSMAVGVDPMKYKRHTALGDARWAMAMFDAVVGSHVPAGVEIGQVLDDA